MIVALEVEGWDGRQMKILLFKNLKLHVANSISNWFFRCLIRFLAMLVNIVAIDLAIYVRIYILGSCCYNI